MTAGTAPGAVRADAQPRHPWTAGGEPSRLVVLAGVFLMTVIGAVHFAKAVDQFQPTEWYVGILFYLNAASALLSVAGMALSIPGAWTLGLAIAAPSFILYFVARGGWLPSYHADPSAVPSGLLAIAVELLFTLMYPLVAEAELRGLRRLVGRVSP